MGGEATVSATISYPTGVGVSKPNVEWFKVSSFLLTQISTHEQSWSVND